MKLSSSPHIAPKIKAIVNNHPAVQRVRTLLVHNYGLREIHAQAFVEQLSMHIVDDFADRFMLHTQSRMRRIVEIREVLHTALDDIVSGRSLPPEITTERLDRLFDDLHSEMRQLMSPAERARTDHLFEDGFAEWTDPKRAAVSQTSIDDLSDAARGQHRPYVDPDLRARYENLNVEQREALRQATHLAPKELWELIASEQQPQQKGRADRLRGELKNRGMSEAQIDNVLEGAQQLGYDRSLVERAPGGVEHTARRRAVEALSLDLRSSVEGDRFLELLAYHAPEMLAQLHSEFTLKGRSGLRQFRIYVRSRMTTHIRGMSGEFHAAFALGERLTILKGPDMDVTIPGTDLVGILANGELWILDNKAVSTQTLSSVTALTRNLPENMASDTTEFTAALNRLRQGGQVIDPNVQDAVGRLAQATQQIHALTRGHTPEQVARPEFQLAIQRILDSHRIRRAVTNAGGKIDGLIEGLSNVGIEFENIR